MAQFPGAAAGKEEPQLGVSVDKELDLVEQPRKLLYFIDDDQPIGWGQALAQGLGEGAPFAEGVGLQQVDVPRLREALP